MTAEKARKIKFAAEFQFVRDLADVPLSSGKKVRRPARKKTVEEQLRTLPRVRLEFFDERLAVHPHHFSHLCDVDSHVCVPLQKSEQRFVAHVGGKMIFFQFRSSGQTAQNCIPAESAERCGHVQTRGLFQHLADQVATFPVLLVPHAFPLFQKIDSVIKFQVEMDGKQKQGFVLIVRDLVKCRQQNSGIPFQRDRVVPVLKRGVAVALQDADQPVEGETAFPLSRVASVIKLVEVQLQLIAEGVNSVFVKTCQLNDAHDAAPFFRI